MLAVVLLVAGFTSAPRATASDEPPLIEAEWAARITSRTTLSTQVVHLVTLPDGAALALVPIHDWIGVNSQGVRVGATSGSAQQALTVVRIGEDGRPDWVSVPATGLVSNTPEQTALVRTASGRIYLVATGTVTVHTGPPTDAAGLFVAEIDPTTGDVLRGGLLGEGAYSDVSVDILGDDLVISGEFVGSTTLGLTEPRSTLTTSGTGLGSLSQCAFIARFAGDDLHPLWAEKIGAVGTTGGRAEAVDVVAASDGTIHAALAQVGTVLLPDGTTSTTPRPDYRLLWLTLDATGSLTGSTVFGAGIAARSIVEGPSAGSAVVVGDATGTVTWGTGASAITRSPVGNTSRTWIGQFDATRQPSWVHQVDNGTSARLADPHRDGASTIAIANTATDATIGTAALSGDRSQVVAFDNAGVVTSHDALPRSTFGTAFRRGADGALAIAGRTRTLTRFGMRVGAPVVHGFDGTAFVVGGQPPPTGAATLTGTVTRSGAPLAEAVITVIEPAPGLTPLASTRSSLDGTWSIPDLPSGNYRVRVTARPLDRMGIWFPDSPTAGGAFPISVAAGETAIANVTLPEPGTARLAVRITVDGKVATGAVAQLFTSDGFVGAAAINPTASSAAEEAVLANLQPGTYLLRAIDPVSGRSAWYPDATRPSTSTSIVLLDGVTSTVSFDL